MTNVLLAVIAGCSVTMALETVVFAAARARRWLGERRQTIRLARAYVAAQRSAAQASIDVPPEHLPPTHLGGGPLPPRDPRKRST